MAENVSKYTYYNTYLNEFVVTLYYRVLFYEYSRHKQRAKLSKQRLQQPTDQIAYKTSTGCPPLQITTLYI